MTFEDLFRDLERGPSPDTPGRRERRVPTACGCDFFIAVRKPDNTRMLRVAFSPEHARELVDLPKCAGLLVQEGDGVQGERPTASVKVVNPAFASVFASLAEDLAGWIGGILDEKDAVRAFVHRLIQWQRLLHSQGTGGLGADAQLGLYGELRFLRDRVLPHIRVWEALAAWTGPDRRAKDFQFTNAAVEVKTSAAKQHQKLHIASERQLDDTGLGALFLWHLSVEALEGSGESLTAIIAELRAAATHDAAAARLLEDRLLQVGWLDHHEALYSRTGYVERGTGIYRVADGFPRIIESMLPPGVGDVRYSISAAECLHFAAAEADLLAGIRGEIE